MEMKFKGLMYSWILTDNAIKYGGAIKKKILLSEIKDIDYARPGRPTKPEEWTLGHITLYRLSPEENIWHENKSTGNMVQEDEGILVSFRNDRVEDAKKAIYYIVEHSGIDEARKAEIIKSKLASISNQVISLGGLEKPKGYDDKKDASVVGRAVVGGIVAGPAGAVVGALSAVDKNNRNKE